MRYRLHIWWSFTVLPLIFSHRSNLVSIWSFSGPRATRSHTAATNWLLQRWKPNQTLNSRPKADYGHLWWQILVRVLPEPLHRILVGFSRSFFLLQCRCSYTRERKRVFALDDVRISSLRSASPYLELAVSPVTYREQCKHSWKWYF